MIYRTSKPGVQGHSGLPTFYVFFQSKIEFEFEPKKGRRVQIFIRKKHRHPSSPMSIILTKSALLTISFINRALVENKTGVHGMFHWRINWAFVAKQVANLLTMRKYSLHENYDRSAMATVDVNSIQPKQTLKFFHTLI